MEKLLASHLRIGNYYDSSDGLTFSITPHDINELFNDPSDDYYNPIPLTEEWLLKFGFEAEDNGSGTIAVFTNQIAIYHNGVGCFSYNASFYEHDNLIDVNSVHQLQNLYFALTNQELTLKQ